MSDTPRTDAECMSGETRYTDMVHYTFAQQLERELAAAKDALLKAHKDYGCELRDPNGTIWEHAAKVQQQRDRLERELADLKESIANMSHPNCLDLLRELAEAWQQRDRLAEALRELCETLLVKEPRDITDLLHKAGKALAAVKGGTP
jgi:HPt (histidine-containing phosphotransfer) domain-containing protein